MKRTDWLSGDEKPAKVGIYQRKGPIFNIYSWWDGQNFSVGSIDINKCQPLCAMFGKSTDQDLPWRGLTAKDGK